ncbi:unnamed protein product, partial [marine sediment metagenome]
WQKHGITGIEQTTSGARMMSCFGKFPVILVATCKAKTELEPPIVTEAVNLHLGKVFEEFRNEKIGIVGYGNVGKAIVKEFVSRYKLYIYDKQLFKEALPNNVTICNSIQELYDTCNLIVGITGEDISDIKWLEYSNNNKTLMSLSSGDIEFNRLLCACLPKLEGEYTNPLMTLKIKTKNGKKIQVLRGGMVANFTGTPDSAPAQSIQLTRGLLFSAVVQAIDNKIKEKDAIKLNNEFYLTTIYHHLNEVNAGRSFGLRPLHKDDGIIYEFQLELIKKFYESNILNLYFPGILIYSKLPKENYLCVSLNSPAFAILLDQTQRAQLRKKIDMVST